MSIKEMKHEMNKEFNLNSKRFLDSSNCFNMATMAEMFIDTHNDADEDEVFEAVYFLHNDLLKQNKINS